MNYEYALMWKEPTGKYMHWKYSTLLILCQNRRHPARKIPQRQSGDPNDYEATVVVF